MADETERRRNRIFADIAAECERKRNVEGSTVQSLADIDDEIHDIVQVALAFPVGDEYEGHTAQSYTVQLAALCVERVEALDRKVAARCVIAVESLDRKAGET